MTRHHSKEKRRLAAIVALGIAAAVTAFGAIAVRHAMTGLTSAPEPVTVAIVPHDFQIVISAKGELQSQESVAIAVPNVPVERLRVAAAVPEGRHISKGDTIVEFDPAEITLQAREHQSSLDMADQKISRGEFAIGLERADIEKDRKIAQLELQKINEFLPKDEQIYSRREIVEAQINKDYVQKKIVFADVRLELKGKVYSLEEAILMLERRQAGSKVDQAQKALASLRLTAPASGIVVYNNPGYYFGGYSIVPGRVVWIGMNLFSLVNPDKMEAKCFVLEKDAGEIALEQRVTVSLDPFPGRTFTGKLKAIDKLARPIDRDSPVKYFQVTVGLDKTDTAIMKPGVKVQARILAGEIKSAIVIPRSAIVRRDSGSFAFVHRGKNFDAVPIALGRGDLIQVAVTQGLKPGDILALNPPDVKPGFATQSRKNSRPSP
jgi:multidrug efflux pump subunit AcrA (membrane-fusion protein)